MAHSDTWDDIDALRKKAYSGMVAVSYVRSAAADFDTILHNFGPDFLKKYLTDIVDHFDADMTDINKNAA